VKGFIERGADVRHEMLENTEIAVVVVHVGVDEHQVHLHVSHHEKVLVNYLDLLAHALQNAEVVVLLGNLGVNFKAYDLLTVLRELHTVAWK